MADGHPTLRLMIGLPVVVPVAYGRGRNRIHYGDGEIKIETVVHALRRISNPGGSGFELLRVYAHAFIPDHYRGQVSTLPDRWITPEILRVTAWVSDNAKSLAPFMASGDREWRLS